MLDDTAQKAFLAGLQSGLGLTKSCQIIRCTPKEATDFLLKNPEFYKECEDALAYAGKVMLVVSQEHLNKKQLGQWKQQNQYIKSFISDLHTWESYCKKEGVKPKTVIEAIMVSRDHDEAATMIGMTKREYTAYMLANPEIQEYVSSLE